MNKIRNIIFLVVALVLVILMNTTVYNTQYQQVNNVETFKGTGYFDSVSLNFDSTIGVGATRSIEFTNDGTYLAVGIESANKLRVYQWDTINEDYDDQVAVSIAGLGSVFSVEFNDNDDLMVVGHNSTPYIKMYDVSNNFDTIVDGDLSVDGTVYDSKFYKDEYLIVAGDMTNYLQVFKYDVNNNFVALSNNIDVLPTNRVTDIEHYGDYIHISTLDSPYIITYEIIGDNLVKIDSPSNLPNGSGQVIALSDNGMYVVVGTTGTPFIKGYKFDDGVYTDVTFDVIPTQTVSTLAIHFIDNSYLYTAGDNAVYKYKLVDGNFVQQVNDVTTYENPVYVMDCNTLLGRFALGDINDYELYRGTAVIIFDNIELSEKPDVVNSVTQNGITKEYLLIDKTMIISDEIYNQDIIVDYNYVVVQEDQLLEVIPIIAILGLVVAIVVIIRRK